MLRTGAVFNALGNWRDDCEQQYLMCGGTMHAMCGQESGCQRSNTSSGVPGAEI